MFQALGSITWTNESLLLILRILLVQLDALGRQ